MVNFQSNECKVYPIYDTWVISALFSHKTRGPILWNNPDVPFEFEGAYNIIAKFILDNVGYISVKKYVFKTIYYKWWVKEELINLCPDTAFYLPETYSKKYLNQI